MIRPFSYYWYAWRARGKPEPALGIYSESDEPPLEQRVKRLEEGRNEDYEFIMDILQNHQDRIQDLEPKFHK